mmetsp:Transcript_30359/g.37386  ORF Transcript_30359/g.37386 Transcript_30359/m.37386 type:complete len:170 (-) Transcript_30359:137-646(-)
MLKNLLLLPKPARLLKNLRKLSTLLDCTRFGLFLMCFNTAYKLVLCLMRRLGNLDDQVNAPVAGFFSALSLAIDNSNRRQLITILTMSRALESSIRIGESSGAVPKLQHRDLFLWVICNCFLQSAMGFRQSILQSGLRKFFQTWSQMKQNDRLLVDVWHKMYIDGVPSF